MATAATMPRTSRVRRSGCTHGRVELQAACHGAGRGTDVCSPRQHGQDRRRRAVGRHSTNVRGRRVAARGRARVLLAAVDGAAAARRRRRSPARSSPTARCTCSSSSRCAGSSARRAQSSRRPSSSTRAARSAAQWSLAIGAFLTLLGASTVFGQLQYALNRVWRVKAAPHAGAHHDLHQAAHLVVRAGFERWLLADGVVGHQRRARHAAHVSRRAPRGGRVLLERARSC